MFWDFMYMVNTMQAFQRPKLAINLKNILLQSAGWWVEIEAESAGAAGSLHMCDVKSSSQFVWELNCLFYILCGILEPVWSCRPILIDLLADGVKSDADDGDEKEEDYMKFDDETDEWYWPVKVFHK